MSAIILWAWDDTNKVYVKVQCTNTGKIKVKAG